MFSFFMISIFQINNSVCLSFLENCEGSEWIKTVITGKENEPLGLKAIE